MMSRLIRTLVCCAVLVMSLATLAPRISFAGSNEQELIDEEQNLVYATKRGKKFHKQDCRFIKNRQTVSIDEEEAIKKGLVPCGRCFAEEKQAKK